LTFESSRKIKVSVRKVAFRFEFAPSDRMILRERAVYDIVNLIAEVSGFADVLIISAAILLRTFYQPKML
jgi:hypothetical protein